MIPVHGAPCRLERAAMRTTGRLIPMTPGESARLVVSGDGPAFSRAVERLLKREALSRLTALTGEMCDALGLALPAVAIGDAKGRWGSCRAPLRGGRRGDPLLLAADLLSAERAALRGGA